MMNMNISPDQTYTLEMTIRGDQLIKFLDTRHKKVNTKSVSISTSTKLVQPS